MERKVLLFGVFLIILPFGCFAVGLHGISKRASGDHPWGYEEQNGPEKWGKHYDKCNGERQSPIDINTSEVDVNEGLDEFIFDNFEKDFEYATIKNNGHTIQVTPGSEDDAPRTLTRGGMDDTYQFMQLHFHWGKDEKAGSEHLINSNAYPLEMHMVFMKTKYETIEKALEKEDGIAVLGTLFKLDTEDNEDLEPIIDQLGKEKKENADATKMGPFKLLDLLPDDTMPYYRYMGSLTTPPCFQSVIWTIFKQYQKISRAQLQKFYQLTEDEEGEPTEPLVNNFRPPQKLNMRIVEISGTSNSASSLIPSFLTAVFTAVSFLL